MRIQVDAVKGIKIDKVTVWDGGGKTADGKTTTANFLSSMMKSIPPCPPTARAFSPYSFEIGCS